jgi:hypothetical protein
MISIKIVEYSVIEYNNNKKVTHIRIIIVRSFTALRTTFIELPIGVAIAAVSVPLSVAIVRNEKHPRKEQERGASEREDAKHHGDNREGNAYINNRKTYI